MNPFIIASITVGAIIVLLLLLYIEPPNYYEW